jgi:hypothetical protein
MYLHQFYLSGYIIKLILWIKATYFQMVSPNVAKDWLSLLLSILEVPGSNLGLQNGYSD